MERVAVEDDELRVDAAPPERLHVRPRHAGRVDRAVDDAQRRRAASSKVDSVGGELLQAAVASASTIARIVSPMVSPG